MNIEIASPPHADLGLDIDRFWALADRLQEQTVDHAGEMFAFVERASPERLYGLLAQYRCFTVYYIADIALLIARLPPGRMRSFLADILYDELGSGDHRQAHPELYDDFLASLGLPQPALDSIGLADNIALLERARERLIAPCQIYLARLYEHLRRNPYIRANAERIDWRFWDLHVGEHDIAHREKLRKLIGEELGGMAGDHVESLSEGYRDSMQAWSAFWKNILDEAVRPAESDAPARAPLGEVVLGPREGRADDTIAQFHLAIGVHDLMQARQFYCEVLGARQGRSTKNLIDLDFYGHHLVIHQAPRENDDADASFGSAFYGETVRVPHFGMNLNWRDWSELAERIKEHGYRFIDPPHVRMRDLPGEHATMFLDDPSGNALEFKAFRNHAEVFAVIFSNETRDILGLESLVKQAATA
jgi:extradiol dioxygenase family protein